MILTYKGRIEAKCGVWFPLPRMSFVEEMSYNSPVNVFHRKLVIFHRKID